MVTSFTLVYFTEEKKKRINRKKYNTSLQTKINYKKFKMFSFISTIPGICI